MGRSEAEPARHHGWLRTNLEAFTIAITLALVIKSFLFEAFQVPTESMEPTIIGEIPGGDHILASRLPYRAGDPERFDVAVFRYPLSGLVNYVKRVCGLPGERVRIVRGDLFIAEGPAAPLRVARKPDALREAILRAHPALPEGSFEDFSDAGFGAWWLRPPAGTEIAEGGAALRLDAASGLLSLGLRPDVGISDVRRDPRALERQGGDAGPRNFSGNAPVGDLRLEVDVEPESAGTEVFLRLVDCTWPSRPLELRLGTEPDQPTRLLLGNRDLADANLRASHLSPGRRHRVILENVDDRIRVLVDDEVLLVHDYEQPLDAAASGSSHAAFGLRAGRATMRRVALLRDLHYVTDRQNPITEFEVPPGCYLMLGDNSPSSLDSRGWRAVGIRRREDGLVLLGDLEGVSDDLVAPRIVNLPLDRLPWLGLSPLPLRLGRIQDPHLKRHSNPFIPEADREHHGFIDIFGNRWLLEPESYDILDLSRWAEPTGLELLRRHGTRLATDGGLECAYRKVSTRTLAMLTGNGQGLRGYSARVPYVPRQAILARALAVFLPVRRASLVR